ncbi:unnamed protein product, partial [Phaeothamnion confervicola]
KTRPLSSLILSSPDANGHPNRPNGPRQDVIKLFLEIVYQDRPDIFEEDLTALNLCAIRREDMVDALATKSGVAEARVLRKAVADAASANAVGNIAQAAAVRKDADAAIRAAVRAGRLSSAEAATLSSEVRSAVHCGLGERAEGDALDAYWHATGRNVFARNDRMLVWPFPPPPPPGAEPLPTSAFAPPAALESCWDERAATAAAAAEAAVATADDNDGAGGRRPRRGKRKRYHDEGGGCGGGGGGGDAFISAVQRALDGIVVAGVLVGMVDAVVERCLATPAAGTAETSETAETAEADADSGHAHVCADAGPKNADNELSAADKEAVVVSAGVDANAPATAEAAAVAAGEAKAVAATAAVGAAGGVTSPLDGTSTALLADACGVPPADAPGVTAVPTAQAAAAAMTAEEAATAATTAVLAATTATMTSAPSSGHDLAEVPTARSPPLPPDRRPFQTAAGYPRQAGEEEGSSAAVAALLGMLWQLPALGNNASVEWEGRASAPAVVRFGALSGWQRWRVHVEAEVRGLGHVSVGADTSRCIVINDVVPAQPLPAESAAPKGGLTMEAAVVAAAAETPTAVMAAAVGPALGLPGAEMESESMKGSRTERSMAQDTARSFYGTGGGGDKGGGASSLSSGSGTSTGCDCGSSVGRGSAAAAAGEDGSAQLLCHGAESGEYTGGKHARSGGGGDEGRRSNSGAACRTTDLPTSDGTGVCISNAGVAPERTGMTIGSTGGVSGSGDRTSGSGEVVADTTDGEPVRLDVACGTTDAESGSFNAEPSSSNGASGSRDLTSGSGEAASRISGVGDDRSARSGAAPGSAGAASCNDDAACDGTSATVSSSAAAAAGGCSAGGGRSGSGTSADHTAAPRHGAALAPDPPEGAAGDVKLDAVEALPSAVPLLLFAPSPPPPLPPPPALPPPSFRPASAVLVAEAAEAEAAAAVGASAAAAAARAAGAPRQTQQQWPRHGAYFCIAGCVDGLCHEIDFSTEEWTARRVVVEVKNRMRASSVGGDGRNGIYGGGGKAPSLFDQLQLAVYMLMLGAEAGDLVQFVRGGRWGSRGGGARSRGGSHGGGSSGSDDGGGNGVDDNRMTIWRVVLDEPLYQHRRNWHETVVPRLYAVAAAVRALREDGGARRRLLAAPPHEQFAQLRARCPFFLEPRGAQLSLIASAATLAAAAEGGGSDDDEVMCIGAPPVAGT